MAQNALFSSFSRLNTYVAHVGGTRVSVSKLVRSRIRWRSVLFPGKKRPATMQHIASWRNRYCSPIGVVAWSPDERLLLAGGAHGVLLGWDVVARRVILEAKSFPGYHAVLQIAVDPTCHFFAARTSQYVQVWQIATCRRSVKCRRLKQIAVAGGGRDVLSWARDEYVLWLGQRTIWSLCR